ncbi:HutD/Ves family protein [Xanthomonas campestris]|uniref:HutD/Ves family protein n=1 Tax=Xanthomonas campestris TaxID=339 RepID=UPI00186544EB|nr:HutD family protein [Xanthomonas campestris]
MQLTVLSSRVIPATEYRRERWRNQLGWTREILRLGEPDDAWALRLSIAEIEQNAAFSAFPGIDRELVLLRGNGMQLQFGDGRQHSLLPPYQRLRFAGEEAVTAVLSDGPTQDFNLMWRRAVLQTELLHRPLVGTMLFFADPGSAWAIHLLAGQASFGRDSGLPPLLAGDTAWLSARTRSRFVLDGGGELLAIRVSPAG